MNTSDRPSVAFDASAILAWFWAEPGYRVVRSTLRAAAKERGKCLLHRLTLMEVYARLLRYGMLRMDARRQVQTLPNMGFTVVEPTESLLMSAAELRAETDIPLLDAVVAQTAIEARASILTADPDFRRLAGRIPLIWVR